MVDYVVLRIIWISVIMIDSFRNKYYYIVNFVKKMVYPVIKPLFLVWLILILIDK